MCTKRQEGCERQPVKWVLEACLQTQNVFREWPNVTFHEMNAENVNATTERERRCSPTVTTKSGSINLKQNMPPKWNVRAMPNHNRTNAMQHQQTVCRHDEQQRIFRSTRVRENLPWQKCTKTERQTTKIKQSECECTATGRYKTYVARVRVVHNTKATRNAKMECVHKMRKRRLRERGEIKNIKCPVQMREATRCERKRGVRREMRAATYGDT